MKTMLRVVLMAGVGGALLAQEPGQQVEIRKAQAADAIIKLNDVVIHQQNMHVEADKVAMAFVHDMSAGPIVKNAPYSAEAVTETIQQLFDGNRIVQRESQKLYRDMQGRERREQASPMEIVSINDPVSGESFTLHPEAKTADKRPYVGGGNFTYLGNNLLVTSGAGIKQNFFFTTGGDQVSEPKEESLGTRMIEGVQAEGTRSTTTIPAGAIGNDRAIEIVDER